MREGIGEINEIVGTNAQRKGWTYQRTVFKRESFDKLLIKCHKIYSTDLTLDIPISADLKLHK